jgi:WD40 repeat protein
LAGKDTSSFALQPSSCAFCVAKIPLSPTLDILSRQDDIFFVLRTTYGGAPQSALRPSTIIDTMTAAANPSTGSSSLLQLNSTSQSQLLPHGHMDYVLDMKFDYYGRRFATASGDRTVRVWDLNPDGMWDSNTNKNEWQAHRGPVNRISWAHPEFGQLIATAGAGELILDVNC